MAAEVEGPAQPAAAPAPGAAIPTREVSIVQQQPGECGVNTGDLAAVLAGRFAGACAGACAGAAHGVMELAKG